MGIANLCQFSALTALLPQLSHPVCHSRVLPGQRRGESAGVSVPETALSVSGRWKSLAS